MTSITNHKIADAKGISASVRTRPAFSRPTHTIRVEPERDYSDRLKNGWTIKSATRTASGERIIMKMEGYTKKDNVALVETSCRPRQYLVTQLDRYGEIIEADTERYNCQGSAINRYMARVQQLSYCY